MRRVLFIGQKLFGAEAWNILKSSEGKGYRVVAVCSNQSAQRVWWQNNDIFQTRGSVTFVDNAAKNEDLLAAAIEGDEVDTILCVQHPWILSGKILKMVNYEALNFHNAKLPEYRGYNAVNHALLSGDTRFTCTAHWMADEVDRGQCALQATFEIAPAETAISLYAKSHHAGVGLFREVVLRMTERQPIPRREHCGQEGFYSRNSIEKLREIKAPLTAESEVKARAFFFPPFEPAFFTSQDHKLYVLPPEIMGWEKLTLQKMIEETRDGFTYEIT